jgi:ADP-ribose pyrophosphatase YjhB (NUDIX family)
MPIILLGICVLDQILRAEGIILNDDKTKVLVQCDLEESFYRLPGGSLEFGETAADAIKWELFEEFELQLNIGELACVIMKK